MSDDDAIVDALMRRRLSGFTSRKIASATGPWGNPAPVFEYSGGDSAHQYWTASIGDVELFELHTNGDEWWLTDNDGDDMQDCVGRMSWLLPPIGNS